MVSLRCVCVCVCLCVCVSVCVCVCVCLCVCVLKTHKIANKSTPTDATEKKVCTNLLRILELLEFV